MNWLGFSFSFPCFDKMIIVFVFLSSAAFYFGFGSSLAAFQLVGMDIESREAIKLWAAVFLYHFNSSYCYEKDNSNKIIVENGVECSSEMKLAMSLVEASFESLYNLLNGFPKIYDSF